MRKIRLKDYSCARDLFISCKEAAKDTRRKQRTLEKMAAREEISGGGLTSIPRSKDRMFTPTDLRIDLERAWRDDFRQNAAIVNLGKSVLWGEEKSLGLAGLLGSTYAEILHMRYIDLVPWKKIAGDVGYTVRHCQRLEKIAYEFMDSNGLEETRQGIGLAI